MLGLQIAATCRSVPIENDLMIRYQMLSLVQRRESGSHPSLYRLTTHDIG